jgi:Domain of unknown function (DUF4105)
MRRSLRFALLVLVVTLGIALVPRDAVAHPGDRYTISLITMSPGDPIFFRFGHNAILVNDARRKTHRVYNWGTFSFNEPGLVEKFLQGRLSYWLSVQPLGPTLAHYDSEHRWLVEQELNLTGEQKLELVRKIEKNARPENRKYRYDYYRDNCSTRVRDAIDSVLDGRLKAISQGPATYTYRGQTSRLVADVWWGHVFLNLAMGSFIDQPVTEWDEMFVPGKVRQMVRKVENVDESGNKVPLIKAERELVKAPDRKPPPDAPPSRTLPLLLIGLLMGTLFGWTGFRLLTHPRANNAKAPLGRRLALGLPLGAWTTLTGFLGFLFLFFWTMTDHQVAYHNENLLQTSPLTAAFPVLAIGLMLDRRWARNAFKWLAYVVAAMSVLGLVLKVLPWFNQVNGMIIAFLSPMWIGLAAGPFLADRQAKASKSKASEKKQAATEPSESPVEDDAAKPDKSEPS